MWDARTLDEFEIAFDYKYSTLKLKNLDHLILDQLIMQKLIYQLLKPNETNSATINDNGISPNPQSY